MGVCTCIYMYSQYDARGIAKSHGESTTSGVLKAEEEVKRSFLKGNASKIFKCHSRVYYRKNVAGENKG